MPAPGHTWMGCSCVRRWLEGFSNSCPTCRARVHDSNRSSPMPSPSGSSAMAGRRPAPWQTDLHQEPGAAGSPRQAQAHGHDRSAHASPSSSGPAATGAPPWAEAARGTLGSANDSGVGHHRHSSSSDSDDWQPAPAFVTAVLFGSQEGAPGSAGHAAGVASAGPQQIQAQGQAWDRPPTAQSRWELPPPARYSADGMVGVRGASGSRPLPAQTWRQSDNGGLGPARPPPPGHGRVPAGYSVKVAPLRVPDSSRCDGCPEDDLWDVQGANQGALPYL